MSSKQLVGNTIVRDASGQIHQFGPGDEVPEWAAVLIKNPDLWSDGEGGTPETEDTPEDTPEAPIPAQSGPKATVAAWTAYAASKGVQIDGEPSRKEIIAFLSEEGIPTE